MELALAREYSTSETQRRNYSRMYKPFDAPQLYSFIDFDSYFMGLSRNYPELQTYFNNFNNDFILMEPAMLQKLSGNFNTSFNTDHVINYFFFRLLAAYEDYLPRTTQAQIVPFEEEAYFGRHKKPGPGRGRFNKRQYSLEIREQCVGETLDFMQYANARFCVEASYPTDETKQDIKRFLCNLFRTLKS